MPCQYHDRVSEGTLIADNLVAAFDNIRRASFVAVNSAPGPAGMGWHLAALATLGSGGLRVEHNAMPNGVAESQWWHHVNVRPFLALGTAARLTNDFLSWGDCSRG